MIKSIVAKSEEVGKRFPDIVKAKDGTLVCVYRESIPHGPFPFSRIKIIRSFDEGMTWTKGMTIAQSVVLESEFEFAKTSSGMNDDMIRGYLETLKEIKVSGDLKYIGAGFDCPRLLTLSDGQIILINNVSLRNSRYNLKSNPLFYEKTKYGNDEADEKVWANFIYRSFDSGETWSVPEDIGIYNVCVPSLNELSDGTLMLGARIIWENYEGGARRTQFVFMSKDKGKTWTEKYEIPRGMGLQNDGKGYDFTEGSFLELSDGVILGILRCGNINKGFKVLSYDGGKTWKGPFETALTGLAGRPKLGLLNHKEVCAAYRLCLPNDMLAMHIMTQDAAKKEEARPRLVRRMMPSDYKARKSLKDAPYYINSYYPGRTLVVDMDRSVHSDNGYPGWVQLDSGDIFMVDYIVDEGPYAHIRGYRINRSDIILFPEGDMPWIYPGDQPWLDIAQEMAIEQIKKNKSNNE